MNESNETIKIRRNAARVSDTPAFGISINICDENVAQN